MDVQKRRTQTDAAQSQRPWVSLWERVLVGLFLLLLWWMFVTMLGIGLQEEGITARTAWLAMAGLYLAGPAGAVWLVRGVNSGKPRIRQMTYEEFERFKEEQEALSPSRPGTPGWLANEDQERHEWLSRSLTKSE